MTHFVAAWVPPNQALAPETIDRLTAALSTAGEVSSVTGIRCAVAFWDSKIWPGESALEGTDCSVVVAGDPVLIDGGRSVPRAEAVEQLRKRLLYERQAVVAAAEGTYAAIAWDSTGAMLTCTDKLGVRPIYWAESGGVVYVSTVQWALTRIKGLASTPDFRGVVETCTFGAPLADRTLWSGIRALGAGELIDLTGDRLHIRRYWDWTRLEPSVVPDADLPRFITAAFNQAVDDRLHGQGRVFAFLSGGMDSRLIVSRLRERGSDVCALNFAPPGSQDLLFGRMAAQATGTQLFEFKGGGTTFEARRDGAFAAWAADPANAGLRPVLDRLVWSGDGGSVALGHVYLNENIVVAARTEDANVAARAIQVANRYYASPASFSKRCRDLDRR